MPLARVAVGDDFIITDADLHAYLLSGYVGSTCQELGRLITAVLSEEARWHSASVLKNRCEECGHEAWAELGKKAFKTCPHNLAERFQEAMLIYRVLGTRAIPELLPLAGKLLQADITAYYQPEDKPYRDHLAHQTRVASLAHLLLNDPADFWPDPWPRFLQRRVAQWPETREHTLLLDYLVRRGISQGFPGPEDILTLVRCSALLAGLVHDIGYQLKVAAGQGADPKQALEGFGVFPPGVDEVSVEPYPALLFYRRCFRETWPGGRYRHMADYVISHPDDPHGLTGALWLALLPGRLAASGRLRESVEKAPEAWGRLEFVCQLAALMALAHDLPLGSNVKQKELGFLHPLDGKGSMAEAYPFTAVFALADCLNEFGRPVLFTGPRALWAAPAIVGLQLLHPNEIAARKSGSKEKAFAGWSKQQKALGILPDGMPAHPEDGGEVFWAVPRRPGPGASGEIKTNFDPQRVGEDIPGRLVGWGFQEVFFQRDPKAVKRALKWKKSGGLGLKRLTRKRSLGPYPLSDFQDGARRLWKHLTHKPME